MSEADADPLGRGAGGGVVLAVDDVADPADGEAECDARCCRVGAVPDRHAAAYRREISAEHAADRRPPDRDAAGPDEEDLERVGEVVLPLIEDMDEPRADDAAHDAPRGDRPPILLADLPAKQTEREPDAEENADGREDPVPGERDRSEMDV